MYICFCRSLCKLCRPQDDISFYRANGYLFVEDAISAEQLAKLQEITYDLMEQSRDVSESNDRYDLDEGHAPDNIRLTRIKLPHLQHPYYFDVLRNSRMTDVLTSLLGPNTALAVAVATA